jgi:hypothetical protein
VTGPTTSHNGRLRVMADVKISQGQRVRHARTRALRIATAYANIQPLSEVEFCRLVDDLTLSSLGESIFVVTWSGDRRDHRRGS